MANVIQRLEASPDVDSFFEFEEIRDEQKKEFLKKTAEGVLETELGLRLIMDIFKHCQEKIRLSFSYEESKCENNRVILTDRVFYCVKGCGRETRVSKKQIDHRLALFHELIHLFQCLIYDEEFIYRLKNSLPLNLDYDNRMEEMIIEGTDGCDFSEHAFSRALNLPLRFNHHGSIFPPARNMAEKSKEEIIKAFCLYLSDGISKDLLILADKLSDEEIEKIVNESLKFVFIYCVIRNLQGNFNYTKKILILEY